MPTNGEPDAQELLPSELREHWAVVPRAVLYQLFMVGALIGAGVALSIAGVLYGVRWMWFGFPVALGVAQLLNMVVPWGRGADRALREVLRAEREIGDESP